MDPHRNPRASSHSDVHLGPSEMGLHASCHLHRDARPYLEQPVIYATTTCPQVQLNQGP